MKRRTRTLAILGGIVTLVLVLLLVLPMFFSDQISSRAKVAANQNVNARVDWRDAGLSFFRHFPNLTLRLDDLTVANAGRFEGDTLAAVRHLGVVLDLGSVLGYALSSKPIVVRGWNRRSEGGRRRRRDPPGHRPVLLRNGLPRRELQPIDHPHPETPPNDRPSNDRPSNDRPPDDPPLNDPPLNDPPLNDPVWHQQRQRDRAPWPWAPRLALTQRRIRGRTCSGPGFPCHTSGT